jgi:glycine betaine/proline transport system ATP-binding protein
MEGGRIIQIGSPDEILKNPSDEYVRSFFRGVDPTTVFCAGDIARKNQLTLFRHKGEGLRVSLEQLQGQGRDFSYILDKQEHYQGVISIESLIESIDKGESRLETAFLKDVRPVRADTPLKEVLPIITRYYCPVPVVDKDDIYQGVISKNAFLKTLEHGIKE